MSKKNKLKGVRDLRLIKAAIKDLPKKDQDSYIIRGFVKRLDENK